MNLSPLPPVSAVIVAAGSGSRFGGDHPKQLAILAGRPVVTHALSVFEASPIIAEIILVTPAEWQEAIWAEAVVPFKLSKVRGVVGGQSRTDSTRLGLNETRHELVLIHDGVRPIIKPDLIAAVAQAAWEAGAALAAVPVRDTLKLALEGRVEKTIDRSGLWQAQTPQGFRREILIRALAEAGAENPTDDIGLVEKLGFKAVVVPGSPNNLKITEREDLDMAEALLNRPAPIRLGHGYDLHRLVPDRPLFLGCLPIPFDLGLLGHSDADVMAHALADALLGAAALGDIGLHFPDRDPQWGGLAGSTLLSLVMAKVRGAGYELVNADLTLVGEKPKIGAYRQEMAKAVAMALGVDPGQVNIKATTTEGQDSTGQGLALAAWATAALKPLI